MLIWSSAFFLRNRTGPQAFQGPSLNVRSTIQCASASTTAKFRSASHVSSQTRQRSHSWPTCSLWKRIVARGSRSGYCTRSWSTLTFKVSAVYYYLRPTLTRSMPNLASLRSATQGASWNSCTPTSTGEPESLNCRDDWGLSLAHLDSPFGESPVGLCGRRSFDTKLYNNAQYVV